MKLRTAAFVIVASVVPVFSSARGVAQTSQNTDHAPSPRFAVASVKVNRSGSAGAAISRLGMKPDGSFIALNADLSSLLQAAYDYSGERILGLPKWADDAQFDITAKAPTSVSASGEVTPEQIGLMVRSLLVERFKLTAHTEMRERPAYALRVLHADGSLGPGLLPTDRADCAAMRAGRGAPPADSLHPCGFALGFGNLSGGGVQIDELARQPLTRLTGRPVIDRTGLRGIYDVALTFPFGETPSALPRVEPGDPIPIDPNRPTIFTAIQEQLGLKLESVRAPVDVLVIDHIERPDPD